MTPLLHRQSSFRAFTVSTAKDAARLYIKPLPESRKGWMIFLAIGVPIALTGGTLKQYSLFIDQQFYNLTPDDFTGSLLILLGCIVLSISIWRWNRPKDNAATITILGNTSGSEPSFRFALACFTTLGVALLSCGLYVSTHPVQASVLAVLAVPAVGVAGVASFHKS